MPRARFLQGTIQFTKGTTYWQHSVSIEPCIFECRRLCPPDGPKANADGQTLGNVVHCDGHDEQEDPPPMVVVEAALRGVRQVSDRDTLLRRVAAGFPVTATHKSATAPAATNVLRALPGGGRACAGRYLALI